MSPSKIPTHLDVTAEAKNGIIIHRRKKLLRISSKVSLISFTIALQTVTKANGSIVSTSARFNLARLSGKLPNPPMNRTKYPAYIE
jgi:hypothetical protein